MCLLIRTIAFRHGRFDGLASRYFGLAIRFDGLDSFTFLGLVIRFIMWAATTRWVFG